MCAEVHCAVEDGSGSASNVRIGLRGLDAGGRAAGGGDGGEGGSACVVSGVGFSNS
jgi:hypothetical protein